VESSTEQLFIQSLRKELDSSIDSDVTAGPSIQNSQTVVDALPTLETSKWQRMEVTPAGTFECSGILNCFKES